MQPLKPSFADRLAVFVAEGFGIGRMHFAPGTFGSALGLGWIYLLLLPRSIPLYIGGIVVGFFCRRLDRRMGGKGSPKGGPWFNRAR